MVFTNTFYQWCDESGSYCTLGNVILVICIIQIVISIAVPILIQKYREIGGFSTDFQFLFTSALAFKYFDDRTVEHFGMSDSRLDSIFEAQLATKRFVVMMMMFTLCVTLHCVKDLKFDELWSTGGVFVSLIFAFDDLDIPLSAMNTWMIGSFMDIIAWITLFKNFARSKTFITESYVLFIFLDHILKVIPVAYDKYRDQLYLNVGYKLDLIKFFLCCCFTLRYITDDTKITSEVSNDNVVSEVSSESSRPSVPDLNEKCLEKSIYCIENEKNTLDENKHELLSLNESM